MYSKIYHLFSCIYSLIITYIELYNIYQNKSINIFINEWIFIVMINIVKKKQHLSQTLFLDRCCFYDLMWFGLHWLAWLLAADLYALLLGLFWFAWWFICAVVCVFPEHPFVLFDIVLHPFSLYIFVYTDVYCTLFIDFSQWYKNLDPKILYIRHSCV